MADAQSIISKFIRTLIGALIIGGFCWLTIYIIGLLLVAFHIAMPAFVVPIICVIFLLIFIAFCLRTWGWNFQF